LGSRPIASIKARVTRAFPTPLDSESPAHHALLYFAVIAFRPEQRVTSCQKKFVPGICLNIPALAWKTTAFERLIHAIRAAIWPKQQILAKQ
jgi:hypothetical protein